jgi:hypothetical protein
MLSFRAASIMASCVETEYLAIGGAGRSHEKSENQRPGQ